MKFRLNLIGCLASLCILFYTTTNAFSRSSHCETHKRHHSKCCKRGPKGDRGHRGHKGKKGDRGKKGERGKRGKKGEAGKNCDCSKIFGSWFIPGSENLIVLNPGQIVPFVNAQEINGITNAAGVFTFTKTGFYSCTFSIMSVIQGDSFFFDLVLNPNTDNIILDGGEINANNFDFPAINPATLNFAANAGDQVVLRYNNSSPTPGLPVLIGENVVLGPNPGKENFAYISFTQLE
ncbi:MAG: hypothetical protein C5B43_03250 [Verrucomicrobia bacterium]|nr:MAG: hypothetical protein C5B43_03250 [Verrucomicrobiota bacterium]